MNTDFVNAQFNFTANDINVITTLQKIKKELAGAERQTKNLFNFNANYTTKNGNQTSGSKTNNTNAIVDIATQYKKLLTGLDLIDKYQKKYSDIHVKEMQLRNEINADLKIMARETGKILRQIQSYHFSGIGGSSKTGISAIQGVAQMASMRTSRDQLSAHNTIVDSEQKNRRADELHQVKMANLQEDNRRKDEIHQDKQRIAAEKHQKQLAKIQQKKAMLHDSFINEASFGGIYLTGLAASYALAPYSTYRDYEKELTIAAKNISSDKPDEKKINTIQDVREFGKTQIMSMYADPNNAVFRFGITPQQNAMFQGGLVQAGVPTSEIQAATNLVSKLTSVLEVTPEVAMEFVSRAAKQFLPNEFAAYQSKNSLTGDQGMVQFTEYLSAMINDLSKKNPTTAKAIIEAFAKGGPAAQIGNVPASLLLNILTHGLSKGFSPQVMGTIATRVFANFSAAMTDKKIWDSKTSEKKMIDIASGASDYLGIKGEGGAMLFTIGEILSNANKGNITDAEVKALLNTLAQGKTGQQKAIAVSYMQSLMYDKNGKRKTNEQYKKDVEDIMKFRLGEVDAKNLSPDMQRILNDTKNEEMLYALSLQGFEDRARLAKEISKTKLGEIFLPMATSSLNFFTKTLLGYSGLEDGKEIKDGNKKLGGLLGFMDYPIVQTGLRVLGAAVLAGITLQIAKIIKRAGDGIWGNVLQGGKLINGRLTKSALFGGIFSRRANMLAHNKLLEQMIADNIMVSTPNGVMTPMQARQQTKASQRQTFSGKMNAMQIMAMRGIGLSGRQSLRAVTPYARAGGGALGALGIATLLHGSEQGNTITDSIMKTIDSIGSGLGAGAKSFSNTTVGKGLGGGLSAITDFTSMQNMVAYYLLMSGNKVMATGAAVYLGNKFFNGFYDKIGANEGLTQEQIDTRSALRSAALTALMYSYALGPAGIYVALGAAAYLGFDFTRGFMPKINQSNANLPDHIKRGKEVDDFIKNNNITSAEDIKRIQKQAQAVNSVSLTPFASAMTFGAAESLKQIGERELRRVENQAVRNKEQTAIIQNQKNQSQPNIIFNVMQNRDGTHTIEEVSFNDKKYDFNEMVKNKGLNFSMQELPVNQTA